MNRIFLALLTLTLAISVSLVSPAAAAILEVPTNGGDASGIGYFSGWKCPPNDNVTIVLDGGAPLTVPSGVRRGDTAGVCGNTGFNGYITQYNFNLLGEGFHTASVRQNGVQFAQSTFNVTTFGVNFLSGASGIYVLNNFPSAGQTATIEWVEGAQNFVIVDTSGGGGTEAAVRYYNDLDCDGFEFTSTLSANGYVWSSFSGVVSQYQVVTNRTSLGPFTETNSTLCGDLTYPFTLPISAGRAYTLVQTFYNGGPYLWIEDEGPSDLVMSGSSTPAPDTATRPADASRVGGPGVMAEGTGVFSGAH